MKYHKIKLYHITQIFYGYQSPANGKSSSFKKGGAKFEALPLHSCGFATTTQDKSTLFRKLS